MEFDMEVYYGGIVYLYYCSIDVLKYYLVLLKCVVEVGVIIKGGCVVVLLECIGFGFKVVMDVGILKVSKVILVMNGYFGCFFFWY